VTADRRAGLVLLAAGAAGTTLALGGCTVGSGSGSASGPLWVLGCEGTQAAPAAFDLHPTFFAADPIDDPSQATNIDRLLIRMQRTGQAIEINDALYFDVENSYEIARCVRGRTNPDGSGDFDMTDMGLGPWCDQLGPNVTDGGAPDAGTLDAGAVGDAGTGPGPAGCSGFLADRAAIRITSQGYMQSSLQLLASCPLDVFTAAGTTVVGHADSGWIQFLDFGTAVQADRPASGRDPIPTNFKVNYGERLRANFCNVHMADDRVLTAQQTQPAGPIPAPLLDGTLNGNFDFDLVRGRAAQPFP
jgi:hypothetical protein